MRFSPATTVSLAVAGLLIALGLGGLFAPQFRADQVTAVGGDETLRAQAETLARSLIAEHAALLGAPRLLLVPRDLLTRELVARLPQLATVQVLRQLPGRVELHLQQKVPVAYLNAGGRHYALDNTGRAIAEVSAEEARTAQLPVIRDELTTITIRPGDAVVRDQVIALLHEIVVLLPERLSVNVAELILPAIGAEEIHVQTDAGWRLLLDTRRPLADQLAALEKVAAEQLAEDALGRLEYLDLRVPGKVYYRLLPRSRRPPRP